MHGIISPNEQLLTVAANFILAGGQRAQWVGAFDRAVEMSGKGQDIDADCGQVESAQPRHTNEGEEAKFKVPQGQSIGASSPSHRLVTFIAREPTAQQRSIGADNAKKIALTVMDTMKIDGLSIGDWTITNALRAGKNMTHEGLVLLGAARRAKLKYANLPGNTLLRHALKPADMQNIVRRAMEKTNVF